MRIAKAALIDRARFLAVIRKGLSRLRENPNSGSEGSGSQCCQDPWQPDPIGSRFLLESPPARIDPRFQALRHTLAMQPTLRIAIRAARSAGQIIERAFRDVEVLPVENKTLNDYVTRVDRASEKTIIEEIRKSHPQHRIVGEEFGEQGPKESDCEWIIDPLDGTTNFIRGIPQFAVSIACLQRGKLEHAVVYDPIKQEEFSASRGQGATLNGRKIRVANRKSLTGALLVTGIPFTPETVQYIDGYHGLSKALLLKSTAGIRRPGAASLDLAYLAAGRFDGFWEINLKPWDIAAGVLLIREAGGLVSDLSGGETYMTCGNLLCASPKIYKDMLPLVQEHLGSLIQTP